MTTGGNLVVAQRARHGPLAPPRHPLLARAFRRTRRRAFSCCADDHDPTRDHPHPPRRPAHAGRRLPAPARGAGRAGVPAGVGRARRAGRPLLVPRRRRCRSTDVARRGGRVRRPRGPGPGGRASRRSWAAPSATSATTGSRQLEPVPLPAAARRRRRPAPLRFLLARSVVAFDHVRRTLADHRQPGRRAERVAADRSATPAAAAARRRRSPAGDARTPRSTRDGYMAVGRARQGAHRRRRRVPDRPLASARARRTAGLAVRHLPGAARGQPLAVHVPARHRRASSWSAPRPRCWCASTRTARASCGRSPAPGRAGTTRAARRRAGGRAAGVEKERAEHVMLVDLGRNDLGRVCEPGSVRVDAAHGGRALLARHAHRVAACAARSRAGRDALDAAAGHASRPAPCRARRRCGRCRSSPSSRAAAAGVYAGAVGYLGFGGDMDTCIAIRTLVMRDGVAYLQAGAGIVADSRPGCRVRGVHEQGGGAGRRHRPRPRRGAYGPMSRACCDRQLRLVHLQPGRLIASAGAEVRGRAQRRDRAPSRPPAASRRTSSSPPGPGRPADAGVSAAADRALAGRVPVLGVCLGHQVIVRDVRRQGRPRRRG